MKGAPEEELNGSHGILQKSMALLALALVSFVILATPPTSLIHRGNVGSKERSVDQLTKLWEESYNLDDHSPGKKSIWSFPPAPHLENCHQRMREAIEFDNRDADGRPPLWLSSEDDELEFRFSRNSRQNSGPPWVKGGNTDNLPLTRAVQRDLWRHQHPRNCSDPRLKFLVTDWLNDPGLGLGAQVAAVSGILAIALREQRILVLKDFDRAKHEDCKGASSGRWSCYFASETSDECRARAMELEADKTAWKQGTIAGLGNFSRNQVWIGPAPELWGKPWETMQTFDIVNGELLTTHKAMDRHWWRAQAVRYFMRFTSQHTCKLLNKARNKAFGRAAAEAVLQANWRPEAHKDVMKLLWRKHLPWMPRPLVSLHVRQGDKATEMEIFGLKSYMSLVETIRSKSPDTNSIWLSTEMKSVVDEAVSNYTHWNFYFTDVMRQNGTTRMRDYEKSLGTKVSSNNAFVNLLMAVDCDYFVGALGSTWSLLIDGLRMTGGKLNAGFLSVNKDRYW